MYARLGFSIATDVNADILLIDEILGVGDEAFQKKSYTRIEEYLKASKTVLFVSHSAQAVERICTRAVVLQSGKVVFDGEAKEAVRAYREMAEIKRSA
jgi:ABC-type polysaccharide/polyol phosphate transport system ATPase subunit